MKKVIKHNDCGHDEDYTEFGEDFLKHIQKIENIGVKHLGMKTECSNCIQAHPDFQKLVEQLNNG